MKSVRLDETLESHLRDATRLAGVPASTFIRQAIEDQCDRGLAQRLDLRLADVIGVVHTRGGRARRTWQGIRRVASRAPPERLSLDARRC